MSHYQFSQKASSQPRAEKVSGTTLAPAAPANLDAFPLDDLPPALHASIAEVHARTQAPIPMIVASALGALSLAQQGRLNVKSPLGHLTPTSLYLVTLADLGLKKTGCDQYFMQGIHEVHHRLQAEDQITYDQYVKSQTAWKKSRRNEKQQRAAALANDPCTPELVVQKPVRPPQIKMISSDVNPATIRKNLQARCPFSSLMSNYADMVFKSKSTSEFTLFNTLWDGRPAGNAPKSKDAIKVKNARFTLSLTTQPETLVGFLKIRQGEAQPNELLARSLVCWPTPIPGWPAYAGEIHADSAIQHLQSQLAGWIEESWQRFQKGRPLDTVACTALAASEWQDFIRVTEQASAPGRAFRDIAAAAAAAAAKAGDNTLRLAALFSQFKENSRLIEASTMRQAIRVMIWYLGEYKRLFGQKTVLTGTGLDMQRMRDHLRQKCHFHKTPILPRTLANYRSSSTPPLRADIETILSWLKESGEIVEGEYGDQRECFIACNFVDPQASMQLTGSRT